MPLPVTVFGFWVLRYQDTFSCEYRLARSESVATSHLHKR